MSTQPRSTLSEDSAGFDPFQLFADWYAQAEAAGVKEAGAMALATATREGAPSVRMVLLRGFDQRGFVFFTNYRSRKGDELAANPRAALVLYWADLDRQVRIEGSVSFVTPEESDEYFRTRPLGSRLGAWSSPQSQVVPDRRTLEQDMAELARRYGDDVPRPDHWGGYRVSPDVIEFWQSRDNRLHDRLRFTREANGSWRRDRLAP